ncbi:cellular communication network factor 1, like 2 [Denticeps clupeoides]|uniref:Uncharacterized protein n=1 Tax=Denticeps clupeoides TaxID=299321 RepID=A0AAY4DLF9_9TELE|nr:protein CYR61-like [Denticeps clupeoides]
MLSLWTQMRRPVIAIVLLLSMTEMVEGSCPARCSCPPSPPSCPMGVSWVMDACGCCKVCAQQFNQDCGPDLPCDHIKGLRCHLGAGGNPEHGLCRAEVQGRPCEFGGRIYQHGEDFQPSCQHQCSCMDGVVGCMPLCPHEVPLSDWHCSSPRLARLPGHCCQEWVCDDSNHISEETVEPVQTALPNHISKQLQTRPRLQASSHVTFQEWQSLPLSTSDSISSTCFPQTTDWSECSATCGYGVSSRITNSNPDCRLVKETRFCQIRECGEAPVIKRGKKCRRAFRPREPTSITFAGCSTARRYRPRFCGSCTDGRCCWPSETRTIRLRFHCPDGDSVTRSVMWIQRCRCNDSCQADSGASGPSVSLHNDIHTFRSSPSLD